MFKNKSDNLKLLQGFNLKKSRIPLFLDFKVKSWRKTNKQKIIDKIKSNLNKKILLDEWPNLLEKIIKNPIMLKINFGKKKYERDAIINLPKNFKTIKKYE